MKSVLLSIFLPLLPLFGSAAPCGSAVSVQPSPSTDSVALSSATPADTTASAAFHPRFAPTLTARLDRLTASGLFDRSQLGLYVYDLTADAPLYARGHRQVMRPASTMKVLTAVLALDALGEDYLFNTRLYTTAPLDTVVQGDLIVRGGFDPLFSHDDLYAMTGLLRRAGVRRIAGHVRLDLSFKDANLLGSGWCWDDDAVSLTPLLYGGKDEFVSALRTALDSEGIVLDGDIREGAVPTGAELLITRSHSLGQVLVPMMKRSDNLFAESVFYQIAALSRKSGAGAKEAGLQMERFVRGLGLDPENYRFADGSGLSLYNRLSPEVLVLTLRHAFRHDNLFSPFQTTLPVMGRDGTLRRRGLRSPARENVWAKTGTVDGVSSLAGYALAPDGHLLAFAIINQGIVRAAEGRSFQDRVCRALTTPFDAATIAPDTLPLQVEEAAEEPSEPSDLTDEADLSD